MLWRGEDTNGGVANSSTALLFYGTATTSHLFGCGCGLYGTTEVSETGTIYWILRLVNHHSKTLLKTRQQRRVVGFRRIYDFMVLWIMALVSVETGR